MSLTRSASGPGGLSINTGTANLFGSSTTTTQAPAAGGLFGGGATSQPAQSTALFGTATSQPQTAGSFGGTNTNSQPQQQSGGLFGASSNTQPATQQAQTGTGTATGLFGQMTTTTTQPQQQQGGLFGASTGTGGGLFGSTANATQQQPQQMSGLFGGGATAQPQQSGGLFGASTNTGSAQSAQPGGLFGASSTAQPQQQTNTGGGGLFGHSQQQQQVVPGVRIDLSNLTSQTRFNDLQEDLQKEIAAIDEGIQKCIKDKEAVDAFLPSHGDQIASIPPDVRFVLRKSEGAQRALTGDILTIDQLREFVKMDVEHAKLSFKAIDNLKLPPQYHQAGLWSTRGGQNGTSGSGVADAEAETNSDLISYFSKTADEMDEMMKKFASNLGEIEGHLHGVQGSIFEQLQRVSAQARNGSQGGGDERISELAAVLRDFEDSIIKVAGVVGGAREGVTELQLKDFMGHGG
ncbi:hypothetical protein V8F33_012758 [Rhypophila sp. PSN 637]